MKKVHDFSQLKYLLATGNTPDEKMPSHKGTWQLLYGDKVLDYNIPFGVAVNKQKTYQMFGHIYPDKSKFSIKPYTG